MTRWITLFVAACFLCLSAVAMAQSSAPAGAKPQNQPVVTQPIQQDEEVAQHSKDSEFRKTEQMNSPEQTQIDKKAAKPQKEEKAKSADGTECP